MKQELIDNINWTGYRKEIEQAISNEHLWAMGAGDDSMLHEQNIEEYTEELENILEGNYNLVIEKYEKTLGEDAAIDHFKGFFINNPEKVTLQAENQRNELFLDALTDIALHVGWEHVEFQDSKERSITLRSWANEFADTHAATDWQMTDYIDTVDEFAAAKVAAWLGKDLKSTQERNPDERISDIHVYSGSDSRTYIRCKIDGEQQISRQLKFADVCKFGEHTDRHELAERYFKDVLEEGQNREKVMDKTQLKDKPGIISDVVTYPGLNKDERYIHCNIGGVRQPAKKLSDEDNMKLGEVIERVRETKIWADSRNFRLALAEKYYKAEIEQMGMGEQQAKGFKR